MWKLKHLFFGWDYIQWSNGLYSGICRVFRLKTGEAAYMPYPFLEHLHIIRQADDVRWLTCMPSKYGLQDPASISTAGHA